MASNERGARVALAIPQKSPAPPKRRAERHDCGRSATIVEMSVNPFSEWPGLNPTRSSDGKRTSTMLDVRGHAFQAVFVCLPTGELSDPAIHGTRSDPMTPEQRIELEAEARLQAMRIKEQHGTELLAGMSVVRVEDLRRCVELAPPERAEGDSYHLDDWDPISGADEVPDPPRSHPVLRAHRWEAGVCWLFWGTLDVQLDHAEGESDSLPPELGASLAERLGAKHVHVRSLWRQRPEVIAIF